MTTVSYNECVTKCSDSFVRVIISDEYLQRIKLLAESIVEAKLTEGHHKVDNSQELKRFTTGLMGEAALEKLLGINIIDWTVGNSNHYHHPDIPGYSIGIKTVEKGKFPIIFKSNHYPQIICIRADYRDDLVFVCGLATVNVLNSYQSDDLILDPKLRARGTKTGFWGFPYLSPVRSVDDIIRYKHD